MVNFITKEARGLLCVAVTMDRAKELQLDPILIIDQRVRYALKKSKSLFMGIKHKAGCNWLLAEADKLLAASGEQHDHEGTFTLHASALTIQYSPKSTCACSP